MSGGRNRWLIWVGALAVAIAVAWAIWIRLLPRESRNDETTFGQFVLAVLGFVTGAFGALRSRPAAPGLDEVADDLAEAVQIQWRQAAGERKLLVPSPIPLHWILSDIPVSAGVEAALSTGVRAPLAALPGCARVTQEDLASGGRGELFSLYAGLPTGRVIVLGEPGVGKTSAAIMLVLDALEHRAGLPPAERSDTPVPILLTLSSWSAASRSLEDWVIAKLREAYPILQAHRSATARDLLRNGSISLILDGLDEVPSAARGQIMRALDAQVLGRVVLLSRTEEAEQAAQARYLSGALAIELVAAPSVEVASYLKRSLNRPPPKNWDALLLDLQSDPDGAISIALSRPLTVGLLRDSFEPTDDVSRLLSDAEDSQEVEDRLLDRFTSVAYSQWRDPEDSEPDASGAERSLRYIARDMHRRGTRDLGWWQLPLMAPVAWRVWLTSLCAFPIIGLDWRWTPTIEFEFLLPTAVLGCLAFGLVATAATQIRLSVRGSRTSAYMLGLAGFVALSGYLLWGQGVSQLMVALGGASIAFGSGAPARIGWARLRGARQRSGAVVALVGILAMVLIGTDLNPIIGFASGVAVLLAATMVRRVTRGGDAEFLGPIDSWRDDAKHALLIGLTFGGLVGLAVLLNWAPFEASDNIRPPWLLGGVVGFVRYLVAGLIFSALSHSSGQTWMVALWLRLRAGVPLRIIRFLDDAHNRGILRTVGPLYQFRHARLQDRLAGSVDAKSDASATGDATADRLGDSVRST